MAVLESKFIINDNNGQILDWRYAIPQSDLTSAGSSSEVVGASGDDSIYVGLGVELDFTASNAGNDHAYLSGNLSDYSQTIVGSNYTFSREVTIDGKTVLESLTISISGSASSADIVHFLDGSIYLNYRSTPASGNSLRNGAVYREIVTEDLDVSGATPTEIDRSAANTSDGVATTVIITSNDGYNVPIQTGMGQSSVINGALGIDTVYVGVGTSVDFTSSGAGNDVAYLSGSLADYTQSVDGAIYTFSRQVDGYTESLSISISGSASSADTVVFADGAIALNYRSTPVSGISLRDGSTYREITQADLDTSTTTPGLSPVVDAVATDDIVDADEKDAGITVTGEAKVGDKVDVVWGETTKTVVAGIDGSWSVTFTSDEVPEDGETEINASITDAAGNTHSTVHNVTVDAGSGGVSISSVATDNVINLAELSSGVTLSGSGEANGEVTLNWVNTDDSDSVIYTTTVTVDADGKWSLTLSATDLAVLQAANNTATRIDATQTVGGESVTSSRDVIVDAVPPSAPTFDKVTTDNVVNAAEKAAGVELSGTAEAGVSLVVTWGATQHTVTADENGVWRTTFTEAEIPADTTASEITAVATDSAGNQSDTGKKTVAIDSDAPALTGFDSVTGDDVVNYEEYIAGVSITGSEQEADSIITVVWGETTKQTTVDADGKWSVDFATAEIPTTDSDVVVTAIDSSGNEGAVGTTFVYIQTVPPGATIVSVSLSDDTGSSATDYITNQAMQTITGVLSANVNDGDTVQVSLDGGTSWQPATVTGKSFSLADVTLSSVGEIQVKVVDSFGNSGEAYTQTYTLDTTAPNAATITQVTDSEGAVTGPVADGGVTDDTQLAVSISILDTGLVAGEKVQLFAGTTKVGEVTLTAAQVSAGSVLITTSTLAEGEQSLTVKTVDTAGNVSDSSAPYTVTIDTTPFDAPTILSVTDDVGIITGELVSGDVTDDTVLSVEVGLNAESAAVGNSVTLYANGTAIGTVLLTEENILVNGSQYSVMIDTTTLANDTSYALTATVTDKAGNESTASDSFSVTIDTTAPNSPVLTPLDDATTISPSTNLKMVFAENIFKGTSGTITLVNDDNAEDTIVINISSSEISIAGNIVTINPSSDLVQGGNYHIEISAGAFTDKAGNAYAGITDSSTWNFSVSNLAVSVDSIADDNMINATEIIEDTTLSGTVTGDEPVLADLTAANFTITLTSQSDPSDTVSVTVESYDSSTGIWSGTIAAGSLTNGSNYEVSVVIVGTTGNANGIETSASGITLTVDATAPDAATISLISETDSNGDVTDSVANGDATNDSTLQIRISLATDASVGDSLQLFLVTDESSTEYGDAISLTADDITNGYVLINTDTLEQGNYRFAVRSSDLAGNIGELSGEYSVTVDLSAPVVTELSPSDDNDSVSPSANLVLTFDETILKGASGSITIVNEDDETQSITLDISSSLITTVDNVLTINPESNLLQGGNYHIEISEGAIVDTSGNNYAGIADDSSWNFTVSSLTVSVNTIAGDDVINAAENSETVSITGNITATESVLTDLLADDISIRLVPQGGGANITLKATDYDTQTGEWTLAIPAGTLVDSVGYNITITVAGTAGAAAAVSNTTTTSVEMSVAELSAPQIELIQETDEADNVTGEVIDGEATNDSSIWIKVSLTDSNATAGSTLQIWQLITDSETSETTQQAFGAPVTVTTDDITNGFVLVSADSLAEGNYTLVTQLSDDAGNDSGVGTESFSFTVDTTDPSLVTLSPTDDATSVAPSANLRLTFSEAMFAAESGTITIVNDDDDSLSITLDINDEAISIDGKVVTINLSNDLDQGSRYHIEISEGALVDAAGNTYSGLADDTSWNFVTSDLAVTLDTIAEDNVVNGAENASEITLSGTVSGDAAVVSDLLSGDFTVTLTPQGGTGTAVTVAVTNYDGSTGIWSGTIAAGTLVDAVSYDVSVSISGSSGNATGLQASVGEDVTVDVDTTAPDAPAISLIKTGDGTDELSDGASTNATSLQVTINLADTGAKLGDQLELLVDGQATTLFGSAVTLTQADITNGYVVISSTSELTEADYALSAVLTDVAGNTGVASADYTVTIDTTGPYVLSLWPTDNSASMGLNQDLIITFDQAVFAATGTITIVNDDNNETMVIDISSDAVTIDGSKVTVALSSDLVQGANYHVEISNGALVDAAGNDYAGMTDATTWNFTASDFSVSVSNATDDNVINADENSEAVTISGLVTADSAVLAALQAGDFTVTLTSRTDSNDVINVVVSSYNTTTGVWSGTIAAGTLVDDSTYDVAVTVTGTEGVAAGVTNTAESDFTVDTTAPTVGSFDPLNNAEISVSGDLVLSFSEAMKLGTSGTITLVDQTDSSNNQVITLPGDNSLITIDGSTITINFADDLINGHTYHVEISDGALTDAAGNNYAGISDDSTWVFTANTMFISINDIAEDNVINLAESVEGVIVSGTISSSDDDALAALTYSDITVTLSNGSDTFTLSVSETDFSYDAVNGAISWQVNLAGLELDSDSDYTVTAVVTGQAETAAAGMTSTAKQTVAVDLLAPNAPTLTITDDQGSVTGPVNNGGSTDDTSLTITINLASTNAVAGDSVEIYAADGTVLTTIVLTETHITNKAVSYTASDLVEGAYSFSAAVIDSSGNSSLPSATTTVTVDTTAPSSPSLTPNDNAADVGPGQALVLNFGETVKKGSAGTVTIYDASSDEVAYIYDITDSAISVSGNNVTINHGGLTQGHSYYVTVSDAAITDAAGNAYSGISGATSWNFSVGSLGITLDTIAGDDQVNAAESEAGVTVTGAITGNSTMLAAVRTSDISVVLSAGGNTYIPDNIVYDSVTGEWSVSLDSSQIINGVEYTVTVAVNGSNGSALGASSSTSTSLVVDKVAPTAEFSPSDNNAFVAPDDSLVLTFSEDVFASTGTITVVNDTDGTSTVLKLTDDGVVINGNVVTVTLADGLTQAHSYHVEISEDALVDSVGNNYAGISDVTGWNFSVSNLVATLDTIASDNIVNQSENEAGVVISGKVLGSTTARGDLLAGDIAVTLTPANGDLPITVYVQEGDYNATDGRWTLTLAEDALSYSENYTVEVTITGTSGAVNGVTATADSTLSVTAPTVVSPPEILSVIDDSGDTEQDIAAGTVTTDSTPMVKIALSGVALDESIQLYDGNLVIGDVVVTQDDLDAGFVLITTPELASGTHQLAATRTTTKGVVSVQSATYEVTVNQAGPTGETVISGVFDDIGDITGNVENGSTTDDTRVGVQVNITDVDANVGDKLQLFDNGVLVRTVTLTSTNLNDGVVLVILTTDMVDGQVAVFTANVSNGIAASTMSDKYTITIDTTAPNAPSIVSITDDVAENEGDVAEASHTNDNTLTIRISLTGTNALVGDTLQILNSDNLVTEVVLTNANLVQGYIDITTPVLDDGDYSLSARVIDVAGNIGNASDVRTLTVDTITPDAPVLNLDASFNDGATPYEAFVSGAITVSAELDSMLIVTFTTLKGTVEKTLTATGELQAVELTVEDLAVLGHGEVTVTATTSDLAGNVSNTTTDTFELGYNAVMLSDIAAGDGGFVIQGDTANGDTGAISVSTAGDINGDGYVDIVVSYSGNDVDGENSGRSYVIYGGSNVTAIDLANLTPSQGFVIHGESAGDASGYQVANLGDVNGDGFADLLISAEGTDKSYVVYGQSNLSSVQLSDIAQGNGGFVISDEAGSGSGYSVSAAGDVNGDGLADIILSNENGTSYVVYGQTNSSNIDLSTLTSEQGFAITGSDLSSGPVTVSNAGDVNGDGFDDIIIGTDSSAYIVYGQAEAHSIDLSEIAAGTGGFAITAGTGSTGNLQVSNAGDVNGDGYADLLVADSSTGNAYIVFGKTNSSNVSLTSLASTMAGYVINGADAIAGTMTVSYAGDINGDGLADFIIGDSSSDTSYVVFGQTGSDPINLTDIAAGEGGFIIKGENNGDGSGVVVSSAGDVNGDGYDDLIVAAENGKSYIVYGGSEFSAPVNLADGLTGTTAGETIIGTSGNELITANGGADIIYAGAGNDIILVNNDTVAQLNNGTALIDGGTGNDTIRLVNTDNEAISLDLSSMDLTRLSSIERFDLHGTAANSLTMSMANILSMQDEEGESGFNAYSNWGGAAANTGKIQLVIDGSSDDTLNLTDMALQAKGAIYSPSTSPYPNVLYVVYNVVGSNVQLIVRSTITLNQDQTGPEEPTILSVTDDTGRVTGDIDSGSTSNDLQPTVTVSITDTGVVAGDTVVLLDADSAEIGRAVITPADIENGTISVQTVSLTEGDVAISAYLIDQANNSSPVSTAFNYVVDVTATDAPSIVSVRDSVGIYQGVLAEGARTDDNQLTLKVNIADINAVAGDTVILFDDGTETTAKVLLTQTDIDNGFVLLNSHVLTDGTHSLTVKVQDAAGNLSDASTAQSVVIDTVAADAPTITAVNDDKGIYTGNVIGGYTDDVLLTIDVDLADTGAVVGDQLVIYLNGVAAGVAKVITSSDVNSVVTIALPALANGTDGTAYTITAEIIDIAGNVSDSSANVNVTVDNVAPNAATIVSIEDDAGAITGNVLETVPLDDAALAANGHYTDDTVLTLTIDLTGTNAVAGDTVWLYDNDVKVKEVTLTAAMISSKNAVITTDTVDQPVLSDGTHVFTVRVVDRAGNISNSSTTATVIVDTEEPAAPVINLAESVLADGASPQEVLSQDGVLTITAEAYSTVTLAFTMDGGETVTREFIATGEAQPINLTAEELQKLGLSGGTISVTATVVDQAGNQSETSTTSFEYTLPDTDLTVFNTGTGLTIIAESDDDFSGYSVSSAGDVNGDGLIDFIVGAYGYDQNVLNEGRSYVVFGTTETKTVYLSDIAAGNSGQGFAIESSSDNGVTASTGFSVSNAGDINGDGYADLLISAMNNNQEAGTVYVVYGKSDSANVNLSDIANGIGGFVINGEASSFTGYSVSGAGDVNGDGLADIIVGAKGSDKAYVIFGKTDNAAIDLANLDPTEGFMITGASAGDATGYSVSNAGDVNGDGLDDVIVSAPSVDNGGAGVSYVIYGKTDGTTVDLANLSTEQGFAIVGESSGDMSGYSVSTAGDLNGDGLADLVIGARGADGEVGKTYVVFGKTDSTTVHLSDIANGVGGYTINGETDFSNSGFTVSNAGDINGDGLSDLIINAMGPNGSTNGRTYVVYGKTDTSAVELSDLSSTNSINGFIIDNLDQLGESESSGQKLGNKTVSAAGDINGDGYADLLIGVGGDDDNISSYVIFGGSHYTGAISAITDGEGTAADETLIGTAGDDVLMGNGGKDVFYAGAGNDIIMLNNDNVAHINDAGSVIDGGTGVDTLALVNTDNVGITLDLTTVGNSRLKSIERFDLTGTADNTLKMSLNDILVLQDDNGQSGVNAFNDWGGLAQDSNRIQIVIDGDTGDTLELTFSLPESPGTVLNNGITYNVYNLTSANVQLLIAQAVTVVADADVTPVVTPEAPTIVSVTDDEGDITGELVDNSRTDDATPTIRVSLANAAVGDKIQLVLAGGSPLGGAVVLTAENISNGYVDITTSTLADNSYSVAAQLITRSGLQSALSDSVSFIVDTQAPSAATIISISDNVGTITGELTEGAITDDAELTVLINIVNTGVMSGDTIRLVDSEGNTLSERYTITESDITAGSVSLTTVVLDDGDYSIGVQITDIASNASAVSALQSFTVDTTPPDAVTASLSSLSDRGVANDDNVTDLSTLDFTINGEANASIALFNDANDDGIIDEGELLSVGVLNENGEGTLTVSDITDGTYDKLKVIQTDIAGNASVATAIASLTVDTAAPTISAIAITDADKASDSDVLGEGNSVTVTVSFDSAVYANALMSDGNGMPTVTLNIGGTTVEASYVDGSGTDTWTFSYTIVSGQEDTDGISIDANAFKVNEAYLIDEAGNELDATSSAVAANSAYKVDTVPPTNEVIKTSPVVNLVQGDNISNQQILQLDDGNYVVVWQEQVSSGKYRIMRQLYDENFHALASPLIVADGGASNPDVGITSTGLVVVAYNMLNSSGINEVYVKAFDTSLSYISQKAIIMSWNTVSFAPSIAIGQDGHFSVAFQYRTSNKQYSATSVYSSTSSDITELNNFRDGGSYYHEHGPVASQLLSNGNYLVAWSDTQNTPGASTIHYYVKTQEFTQNGSRVGSYSSLMSSTYMSRYLDIVLLNNGDYMVTTHGGGVYPKFNMYKADGTSLGTYTRNHKEISFTALDNGGWVYAAISYSNELFVQVARALDDQIAYFGTGLIVDVNTKPVVTALDNGLFTVVVEVPDGRIHLDLYNADGINLQSLYIGDSASTINIDDVTVVSAADGGYIVSWVDNDDVLYLQKYNVDGTLMTVDNSLQNIYISTDTGVSDSDFVTGEATQTIQARLTEALAADDVVYGSVDGGETWLDITNFVDGTYINWTVTLAEGENSLLFKVTDKNGNEGDITRRDYTLDTVDPEITVTPEYTVFRENLDTSEAVYTFSVEDDTSLTYTLSGDDSSLFTVNAATGEIFFNANFDYENPLDANKDNTYSFTLSFTDLAGNTSSENISFTIKDGEKGDTVIDLGNDADGNSLGKLIGEATAEGESYYFWDVNGNGESDTGDMVSYSMLQSLLDNYGTGNENEISVNGITMVLPGYGSSENAGVATSFGLQSGTAVGNGNADNSIYDDLLAVWDANNGTNTGVNQNGTPDEWAADIYWTATESSNGRATVALYDGSVYNESEDEATTHYVAWQVL